MARLPDEEIRRRFEEQKLIFQGSITPQQALERWPDQTPEERIRRTKASELQQAKYNTIVDDDTGQRMLGGPQRSSSGPVGEKAIMERIAELANGELQQDVINAVFAPLAKGESAAVRGKGGERIVKIAAEWEEVKRRDREELRKLGQDELVDRLARLILESGTVGDLLKGLQAGEQKAIEASSQDMDASRAA